MPEMRKPPDTKKKEKGGSYQPPATADDYDDKTTGFTPADYQRAKNGDLNDEIPF